MRFKFIKYAYLIIIVLIVFRLGYWQVIKADDLAAKGEDQRLLTKEVIAPRGTIYFSDGSILASSRPAFLVYAEPKTIDQQFKDKKHEYKKIFAKEITDILWEDNSRLELLAKGQEATTSVELMDLAKKPEQDKKDFEQDILDRLNKDLYWVSLGKKVNFEDKNRLEKLNLTGLGFQSTSIRFYPEGSSSAHLLGFIGSDIYGAETGYFGIEGYYNGELKGRRGLLTSEKDALGLTILIGKFISQQPRSGNQLILTVDRAVQHIAEEKLQKGIEKYGAKGGSVIIMDPKNGNILAMVSSPGYDPMKQFYYPKQNFKNPVTSDSYEPGSTFKVLVMAGVLNEGKVKPDTVCDICSGPVSIGGFSIRTWNNQYYANSTMTDVIIHSDNIGMVYVAQKLGVEKLYEYIKKFGFGKITGIDLQDEESPQLRMLSSWREIDLATASFGQGISVTPIQLIRAVSAIANGGKVFEPHMVSQIKDQDEVFKITPRVIETPIKVESAGMVKEMMVKAVDEGEASYYKKAFGLSKFKIAGKTGTAQIPVAGHYDPTKTIASFIGFAPADNPKFIMLVRYQEPSASIFGADTAAPTFFDIAKELFQYYRIAPDQ